MTNGGSSPWKLPGHQAGETGKQPLRLDTTRPHSARVYDYFLGGKDNFEADRLTGERSANNWPAVRVAVRENRSFLARVVRYLVKEAGIRQFLDIGTGLPSANNVHEVAQGLDPACRVVYVDNDPIVLVHAKALLTSTPEGRTAYLDADLRDPQGILNSPLVHQTLDFNEPVALMLVAILHFVTDDDDPRQIVRTLLDALPAGSYFAASHVTPEHDPEGVHGLERTYQAGGIATQSRDAATFAELAFSGLELIEPGVTLVSEWRPDEGSVHPPANQVNWYGGVARRA